MVRGFLIVVGVLVGGMILAHIALQNGILLRYLDEHPDPQMVPAVEYYVGHGYYLFQDLPEAATYFIRIAEGYPRSKYADDAYFNYVQTLDDMMIAHRQVSAEYQKYLDRFPNGKYVMLARRRMDAYRH